MISPDRLSYHCIRESTNPPDHTHLHVGTLSVYKDDEYSHQLIINMDLLVRSQTQILNQSKGELFFPVID